MHVDKALNLNAAIVRAICALVSATRSRMCTSLRKAANSATHSSRRRPGEGRRSVARTVRRRAQRKHLSDCDSAAGRRNARERSLRSIRISFVPPQSVTQFLFSPLLRFLYQYLFHVLSESCFSFFLSLKFQQCTACGSKFTLFLRRVFARPPRALNFIGVEGRANSVCEIGWAIDT